MEDCITRKEHNDSIQRVHKRQDQTDSDVSKIQTAVVRIEESAKNMYTSTSRLYDVMYGKDDKGGMIARIAEISTRGKNTMGINWIGSSWYNLETSKELACQQIKL